MSTKINNTVYKWLNNIQYFLLPGTCIACSKSSLINYDLCAHCESSLPEITAPCIRCALPLPPGHQGKNLCGTCITAPPPFHFCVSAFEYKPPVNHLISDFKYHGKLCNGRVLAGQLILKLKQIYRNRPLPQLIIPVPLHKRRLRQRGYNQAGELSQYISRAMTLPLCHQLCVRVQDGHAQKGLSADERKNNLHKAFALQSFPDIESIHSVAIVDDVVTTMSTVTALSKLLLEQGINEIHIWSIARTCKD